MINTKRLDEKLAEIIRISLGAAPKKKILEKKEEELAAQKQAINETYVAQPKVYSMVSEYFSQKTKTSIENIYKTHLAYLNSANLKAETEVNSDINQMSSLFRNYKIDETFNHNAVWFTELFLSNCFSPSSELFMDTLAYQKLSAAFGSFENWQKNFIACAKSARNGWVICAYSLFLQKYVNVLVDDNDSHIMAGLFPIICISVHENVYFRDFMTDFDGYLTVVLKEINWDIVEQRIEKAEKIGKILKLV